MSATLYLFKRVLSKDDSEKEIDQVFQLMKDHNVDPSDSWIRRSYRENTFCDLRIDLGYKALYLKENLFRMGWVKEG